MLGDSAVLGTGGGGGSADAVAAPASTHHEGADVAPSGGTGGGSNNSGDDERGIKVEESVDKSFGGNRWPREETLALLKIRSDMDVAFRDASVKGPLWEEVSRKLAELGYHRNAKKCKEKFENVYKYHKRTKEGRSGKSEGKTYRFFDQLQALENNPSNIQILSSTTTTTQTISKPPPPPLQATPVSIVVTTTSSLSMPIPTSTVPLTPPNNTNVPSTTTMPQNILNITPSSSTLNITNTTPSSYPSLNNPTTFFPTQTPNPTNTTITPPSFPNIPTELLSNSSSSSTSSEETVDGEGTTRRQKRKRKWKDFFERLMKEVIEKQEELQRRFLEAIEKREQERVVREEAWRMQEMQRINREREILAQERSIAAAKDAAVMAFLQKIAEQQQQQQINPEPPLNNNNNNNNTVPQQQAPQQATPTTQQTEVTLVPDATQVKSLAPLQEQEQHHHQLVVTNVETTKADNNGENLMMTGSASSSRWPKVEVEALIKLRTSLETKYQESGPKGPLWEEISALMRKMGYNRNAKRCKEKWENINKYFKKVKESNKKRPEDSKTCPYFHQLNAIYEEKNKVEGQIKPVSMVVPLMVQPEQQWPPQQTMVPEVTMGDAQNDPMDRHPNEEDEDLDKEIEDEEDDDDDEEEGGGNYEIVASKPASTE